jgi:hypothetical protein
MASYAYPQYLFYPGPNEHIIIPDESSEEDDDSFLEEESEDESDILRPSLHALGLSRYYVFNWSCQDAFREFYQNW